MTHTADNLLLHPQRLDRAYADEVSTEVIAKTVAFFEDRGRDRLLEAYNNGEWYSDFIEFVGRERVFARFCTPAGEGADDTCWNTWRNCEFAEVMAFYGLQYWYTWQVSVLGLGPLWMTDNKPMRQRAVAALEDGGIFAFGLSEKEHGADIYSSSMTLHPQPDGTYLARGSKYYIGNGNEAAMVSVFGKLADSGDYVFFVVDSQHAQYELVRNVVAGQSYVAEFALNDYPITDADIIHRGQGAWDAALNTINICKFNLGWASIGICTHAFYEATTHAANRRLYNMHVTDFPHVQRLFVDAYARLITMKVFALRAADYMRAASDDDRRYLLYNPMVKMKVTTEGEKVIDLMWDVIAAKGFENTMHFSECAATIRALPKLEGTVHVNIALIAKFMANYFFFAAEYPDVGTRNDAGNDDFLFAQGPTRGLSKIRFHDYRPAFAGYDTPNVGVFVEQIGVLRTMLASHPPSPDQLRDTDFLLAGGELFALVVYAHLFIENARILGLDDDLVDQVFDVLVRDFSGYAVGLHGRARSTDGQMAACLAMIRKPVVDAERFARVWGRVLGFSGVYAMGVGAPAA